MTAYSRPSNGMAASNPNPRSNPLPPGTGVCLSASALQARIEEEISRAGRHGTPLSCLLVVIDNLPELAREHGSELPEQTLAYVGSALRRQLRRFDRVGRPRDGELVVVLPGADSPRGEIVARRVLDRLHTIKVETDGARQPLRVSVGLAAWRDDLDGGELLAQTRAAAQPRRGQNGSQGIDVGTEPSQNEPPPAFGPTGAS
jgi:two-component system, cell cycle response regulator